MKETLTHDTPLILTASIHATIAHRGQFRKGTDIPYVTHPLQVSRILAEETKYPVSSELIAAAILHDVVEDTPMDVEKFPKVVQILVLLVTDPANENGHDRLGAIHRIQDHPDAIMIKMADRYSNLTEVNDYAVKYRAKPDVQESTRYLLTIAKEAKLNETDLYLKLNAVMDKL